VSRKKKTLLTILSFALVGLVGCLLFARAAHAATNTIPGINLNIGTSSNPKDVSQSLQILLLLALLSLAPAILIMMTAFVRIIVVFSFLRSALALQQMPPNQVLIGLALFLTFFVMAPTFQQVNNQAVQPYLKGQITQDAAFNRAMDPMRNFMIKQTRQKDLALFVSLSKSPKPRTYGDIPSYVMIPAFAISELKTAFQIGFILFVPFLVIDMVVSSTLMSMGMMMLPPMMISLPFKILLFIMVDGWDLLVRSLVMSFH
jgi:flagellar biosynthetic protein FliP